MRRFGQEIAPAVREGCWRATARPRRVEQRPEGGGFAVRPTADDGRRRSTERVWDEETRPAGPPADPGHRYSPQQQAAGRHLIDVHDHLRAELEQLRDIVQQVAAAPPRPRPPARSSRR